MECNKEEAIRAKEVAEKKMQDRDFSGAKKIALKAQRLFSELENISQMITVCDVHCCADNKINGEIDWYAILQVEQTADDSIIKKQYRRLALQLHPDKNKFPGAEAAFKLIGEANMTLSDKAKRALYDMKRRSVRQPPPQQRHHYTAKNVNQNANTSYTSGNVRPSPLIPQNQSQTFWTRCTHCFARFQYYRSSVMNKTIPCHRCLQHFVALEVADGNEPQPTQNFAPRPNHPFFTNLYNSNNVKQQAPVQPATKNKDGVPENAKTTNAPTTSTQKKRGRKRAAKPSESNDTTDTEEIDADKNQNAVKKPKKVGVSNKNATADKDKGKKINGQASDENENISNVRLFTLPDSEFYNFEKERDPKTFAADQIWAVYDDNDAMPRYYVRIREVNNDSFMLRFTWLENNPVSDLEQIWTSEELPVACGNYRLGKSHMTRDVQMFSHKISWSKGTKRNAFEIYPIKGEVWALFKGWDANWTSDASNHKVYEYEVVEVLSGSSDASEFLVVHLVKVKGFVSLFARSADGRNFLISRSEILRFAHRVPSYRVSKNEKDGVPEGSFELDTAALPENLGNNAGSSIPADTASVKSEKKPTEQRSTSPIKAENSGSKNEGDDNTNSNFCDVQPNEFYEFADDRLIKKFKKGQIWALYSDIDQYPKFYAKIKKIDYDETVITASWVELSPKSSEEANWIKKELPATCGRFKAKHSSVTFDSLDSFSHIVHAESVGNNLFDVYPRKGEIWALYQDWNVNWTREDFDECKCFIVEILGVDNSLVKVRMLSRVDEYNFVFKPELRGVEHELEIMLEENLRFSHRIPAVKLTDQAGGAVQGFWELDSASVPNM